jgi:site-specific DNA recombinase
MDKSFKIGLYIRVSTEEQAENPEGSIKNQEQRLREMVKFKNLDRPFGSIVGVYIDRAKSGKDTNRPELQRLLADIRSKAVNYVMVSELSRISRNIKDFAEIWEMMQTVGCGFQSLRENFDTTTAAGEMVLYSMANIAQFERRQVSERVKANVNARASRGLYSGGAVPLGYQINPKNPGCLELDPETAPTVQEAFKTFLTEKTLSRAARSLNDRGYSVKRHREGGGKYARLEHFTVDNLHKMLRNVTYAGLKKFVSKDGEKLAQAVWIPLVDEKTFKKVQDILTKNHGRRKPHTESRYPYLLSGLTRCGECGDVMCGKSAHGKQEKIGYYEHSWATKRDSTLSKKIFKCEPHRVLAKKLEPLVWDEVKKLLMHPKAVRELCEEAKQIHGKHSLTKERERLKAQVYGWNSQLDALAERLSQIPKSVSPTPIFKQMEKLESLKVDGEAKLMDLEKMGVGKPPVDTETYEAFAKNLRRFVTEDIDNATKARLIESLVHKVEILKAGYKLHFIVTKAHYEGELEKSSSPVGAAAANSNLLRFPPPSSREGDFFISGCSNTLTFGARRGT